MKYCTPSDKLRGMILSAMLSAYRDWKHPKYYHNSPKNIQDAKDRFFKCKKMYNEKMQRDFHSR